MLKRHETGLLESAIHERKDSRQVQSSKQFSVHEGSATIVISASFGTCIRRNAQLPSLLSMWCMGVVISAHIKDMYCFG